MKIRTGFVSNSSSSSFSISLDALSARQLRWIYDHIDHAKQLAKVGLMSKGDYATYDAWTLKEEDDYLHGYTTMDNFPMNDFLNAIGVANVDIEWGD